MGWLYAGTDGGLVRAYADIEATGRYDDIYSDSYGGSSALEVRRSGQVSWLLATWSRGDAGVSIEFGCPDPHLRPVGRGERQPGHGRRESAGLPEVDRPAPEPLPVEERSALFEALQALPTMQRKVVVLRHWLGLSVAETAHELRISVGTVKSHSSRALESLRAAMADDRG